jgi:transcriptional regulator with GAF, ATPase, and Fis domain
MDLDENQLFREATLRICSSLELDKAIHDTFLYLRNFLPLEELSLRAYERDLGAFRTLVRVTGEGLLPGSAEPLVPAVAEVRELIEHLAQQAHVHVMCINQPIEHPLADVARQMAQQFGLVGKSLIVMGTAQLPGGFFFVADGYNRYEPHHVRLVELLKQPFIVALSNALRYEEVVRFRDWLERENQDLHRVLGRREDGQVIGADLGLRETMELVDQVALQSCPVLLLGETGTGKELVAEAIHRRSERRAGPMVAVNCGGIPETLIDSELFGHQRGAFTGATETKRGFFEHAHRGTIFLDEVGELPHAAQVKLLRVLQSMEVQRVGGRDPVAVDVRVVAATHRDLEAMVAEGLFREDLWFRLNVFPVQIPPLRARLADIPALAHHFIERKAQEMNLAERPRLAPGAIDALMAYSWPGNVRELQNVIERSLILARGGPLRFDDLGASLANGRLPASTEPGPWATLDEVMARHITRSLARCGGRVGGPGGAAELLGLHPSTLRSRMDRLGVPYGRSWTLTGSTARTG